MNIEKFPPKEGSKEELDFNQEENREKNAENKVFYVGKKAYQGDDVAVLGPNGDMERGWKLKSMGNKFAVVEKFDRDGGAFRRKVIPIKEFQDQQIISKEYEKSGKNGSDIENLSPKKIARDRDFDIAQKLGIDTRDKTPDQLRDEVDKKIREITEA